MDKDVQHKSINAIFGWIGGKRLLRSVISQHIPEQNLCVKERKIKYYVEVFGGVAWMLLYKNRWFENEVYNDYNNDLVTLFNVIKFHPKEFQNQFKLFPNSQHYFNHLLNNDVLTDVQRAVKTYFKYAYSFSSNGSDYSFRPSSRINLMKNIIKLSNRLDKVSISNMSYEKIIPRFNRDNVFLYLDPPYFDKEYLYEMKFSREDHDKLFSLLKTFKGKFILSYNNHEYIRELYKDFKIIEIETDYSAFRENNERVTELLIMNY